MHVVRARLSEHEIKSIEKQHVYTHVAIRPHVKPHQQCRGHKQLPAFFSNIIRFVINGHRKKINARPWQSSKTHSRWGSADRQLRADLNSENKADRVHVKTNSRSIFHVPLKMSLLLLFFERTCWRLLFMLRLIDWTTISESDEATTLFLSLLILLTGRLVFLWRAGFENMNSIHLHPNCCVRVEFRAEIREER